MFLEAGRDEGHMRRSAVNAALKMVETGSRYGDQSLIEYIRIRSMICMHDGSCDSHRGAVPIGHDMTSMWQFMDHDGSA